MHGAIHSVHGHHVLVCPTAGPMLSTEADGKELLMAAMDERADMVAFPAARLGEDFLRLRSGVAGAIVQKFVNYRIRLVFVGDISAAVQRSEALRDFVREANQGDTFWFVESMEDMARRLG